jgi:hypothetical protein
VLVYHCTVVQRMPTIRASESADIIRSGESSVASRKEGCFFEDHIIAGGASREPEVALDLGNRETSSRLTFGIESEAHPMTL